MRANLFDAALFDRDGTLIEDVPYNGDPDRVVPIPGAREALDRLRAAGLKLGVVSNQSGVGRGLLQPRQVEAVNRRVAELLGPFDTWHTCLHRDDEGCRCRKPAPGMIVAAAHDLGVPVHRCVMVGDIGSDVRAGEAAGATAILVPRPRTRREEVRAATVVCRSIGEAVDRILALQELVRGERRRGGKLLAVRADSAGDVLQTGPALRALAAGSEEVTLLAGPLGQDAARLLPGVREVLVWPMPWIEADPAPVDRTELKTMVKRLEHLEFDEAVVFTSFHQSPLPAALMLRLAGVPRISAISVDYPGSLLDVRHQVPDDLPEPVRALSLAAAAGFPLPVGDTGRLQVTRPGLRRLPGRVIVHAGARADARAVPVGLAREVVKLLASKGYEVVVTGSAEESERAAQISGGAGLDLGGRTTFVQLADLIGGAACVVTGNTGAAHLAAAQDTPVVSLYAPTVPFGWWGPYGTPRIRLGDPDAPCRDTRARDCALPGHPCLAALDPAEVVEAVETLLGEKQ